MNIDEIQINTPFIRKLNNILTVTYLSYLRIQFMLKLSLGTKLALWLIFWMRRKFKPKFFLNIFGIPNFKALSGNWIFMDSKKWKIKIVIDLDIQTLLKGIHCFP